MPKKIMNFIFGLILVPACNMLYIAILSVMPVVDSLQPLYVILYLAIFVGAVILCVIKWKTNRSFSIGILFSFAVVLFLISYPSYKAIKNRDAAKEYFNRGFSYYEQGKFTQAIVEFDKAVEIYPRYVDAYENRSLAYYKMGNYSKAWEDVYKIENLGPGFKVDTKFLEDLKKASGKEK